MKPFVSIGLAACLVAAAPWVQSAPNVFRDPLDTPARASAGAARSMLLDAQCHAGGACVALGRRGVVVRSDDGGTTWQQAEVPVATDLLALSFADERRGWAVGHAGVVLHTGDGGRHWTRQLDGRMLAAALVQWYTPAAQRGDEAAQRQLADAERFRDEGPGRPLLDVLFTDARHGIAVGAYNLALRTEDGGRSWQPFGEQLDNPMAMHLYALAHIDGTWWIAGEQGLLLRQATPGGRFERVKTPYPGSFFGIVGRGRELVVFGLRGNALRSRDGGATWVALHTGTQSTLTAGMLRPDGRLVLVALNGELLDSADGGETFRRLVPSQPAPLYGVVDGGPRGVVLVGARGVRISPLSPPATQANAASSTSNR
jgi:photosystem II stability/assembly factor-like uncharacterized protein